MSGQYYVPLLRSEDNTTQPMIGQPWSPDRKGALNTLSPVFNPKDPLMAVKACAGPMTPSRVGEMIKYVLILNFGVCKLFSNLRFNFKEKKYIIYRNNVSQLTLFKKFL